MIIGLSPEITEGVESMIKVKVSDLGNQRDLDISQFLGTGDNTFENCHFFVNSSIKEVDHWFVIDGHVREDRKSIASTVNFLSAEHIWGTGHFSESKHYREYLHQFDSVYTTQDFFSEGAHHEPPFLPWMINTNHGVALDPSHARDISFFGSLQNLPKTDVLSVICSNKVASAGHRLRLRFVEKLAEDLGDSLHWYGNGVRETPQKWEAIAPYRFHLALENQSTYGCFSEKIYDAFLGLSLPIYWGAPDIGNFFADDSFISIDIRDYKRSLEAITTALNGNVDRTRMPAILRSRDKVLNEYNVYKRIARIAQNKESLGVPRRAISLNRPPRDPTFGQKVGMRLGRSLHVSFG